ncbi:MAG: O-antigen ligase domain-containing protein [Pseudomonadota bacterium]
MAAPAHHPQTSAERLIATTIQWTWGLWLIGGLYIAGPVLGCALAGMAFWSLYLGKDNVQPIPATVWVWIAGMAAMLVILWIGHSNFQLGTGKTIKSSVGWAKGWALIALFPLAGAVLSVQPEVIYRAICKLGLQTLIILPIFLFAPMIGLPERLWVSPLQILGGAGPDYFAAQLYTIEPGVGTPRWQFFAPWSPAAGMMGVVYVLLAAREKDLRWKAIGIIGGLSLAVFSQSRLALVALAVIAPIVWATARLDKGYLWFLAVPVILGLGIFGPMLLELADAAMNEFSAARADSSRVRAALGRIAIHRWETEAFWFGHGIVEAGPHLVEYMPIGSHHSWYGLLFVKGLTGAIALAVPLALTAIVLMLRSMRRETARVGLGMVLALVLYSFGENLEILAYLYWPALVIIGVALRAAPDPAEPLEAKANNQSQTAVKA